MFCVFPSDMEDFTTVGLFRPNEFTNDEKCVHPFNALIISMQWYVIYQLLTFPMIILLRVNSNNLGTSPTEHARM